MSSISDSDYQGSDDSELDIPDSLMDQLALLAKDHQLSFNEKDLKISRHKGLSLSIFPYRVGWSVVSNDLPQELCVRVYRDMFEILYNVNHEMLKFSHLSSFNYGPRLYRQCKYGRIEEPIPLDVKVIYYSRLSNEEISSNIASNMRKLHELEMPGDKDVTIWKRARKWLGVAKGYAEELEEGNSEFRPDIKMLKNLESDLSLLERIIQRGTEEIGFCHNSWHRECIVELQGEFTLIDFEDSGFNPVAFDIANLFCEAVDYSGLATPVEAEYLDEPARIFFLKKYMESAGKNFSPEALGKLSSQVEEYTLVCHIFWIVYFQIWAYVDEDVELKVYAENRLKAYLEKKAKLEHLFKN